MIGDDHTYSSKFEDPSVKLVVQRNQAEFVPFAESIDEALEFIRNNPQYSAYGERFDAFGEQENSDDLFEFISTNPLERSSTEQQILADNILMEEIQSQDSSNYITLPVSFCTQPLEATDDVFRDTVRSLNTKQCYAYEIVLKWCRDTVKNLSSLKPVHVDPIYLFISGGAGAGKSHVIKSVHQTVLKTFKDSLQIQIYLVCYSGTNWCGCH